jgi:hypothetical protein
VRRPAFERHRVALSGSENRWRSEVILRSQYFIVLPLFRAISSGFLPHRQALPTAERQPRFASPWLRPLYRLDYAALAPRHLLYPIKGWERVHDTTPQGHGGGPAIRHKGLAMGLSRMSSPRCCRAVIVVDGSAAGGCERPCEYYSLGMRPWAFEMPLPGQ